MPRSFHYANTHPCIIQRFFEGCKNDNFEMKKKNDIFIIFAQSIDYGYAVLTSTHNLCFRAKIRKYLYTPVNLSFTKSIMNKHKVKHHRNSDTKAVLVSEFR